MFDIATRPNPATDASALLAGTPFDWRLVQPEAEQSLPWTDYASPSGKPAPYAQALKVYSLACEDTLATAVIISLFTDARAEDDDRLPLGSTDRRGWVGNSFMPADFDDSADTWGNKLWLLYISKAPVNILERARFTAWESLQWLVRDGLASRIEVVADWVDNVLAVRPVIYRAADPLPIYDVLWATSVRRSMGAA